MPKNLGFYPAKNFNTGRGRWSGRQDIIVFHTTAGAAGLKAYENNPTKDPKKFSGSMGWFCNPSTTAQTSSHFIVDREGRYLQVVKLTDMAWCNGNNASMRQYSGVRPIIKGRVDNANLYTYSIECEGYPAVGDPPSTDAEFQAMVEVMKICIDDMHKNKVTTFRPDRDHIIGHCDIDPKNKVNCPARNHAEKFPFDRFIAEAKKYCEEQYPGWIPGSSTTTETTTNIKVGDTVSITEGATWYGSSSKINSVYISGKTYTVDSLNGTRAVLDSKGINSPIDTKYLKVVSSSNTTSSSEKFKVGDKVTVNTGATWYDGKSIPSWVIGKVYTIDELSGSKALLDKNGICSPIDVKYLTRASIDEPIKVGDKVTIVTGAKWWSGSNVPGWAIGTTYTVDELNGDRAVLSKTGINSPINVKYLKKA